MGGSTFDGGIGFEFEDKGGGKGGGGKPVLIPLERRVDVRNEQISSIDAGVRVGSGALSGVYFDLSEGA